jgi:hypothetical protein
LGVPTSVDGRGAQVVVTAMSEGGAVAAVGAGAALTVADGLGPGNIGGISIDPGSSSNFIAHSFRDNARILIRQTHGTILIPMLIPARH